VERFAKDMKATTFSVSALPNSIGKIKFGLTETQVKKFGKARTRNEQIY
jgi:hypothetical protein